MKIYQTRTLLGFLALFLLLGIFLMSYLQSVLQGSTMSLGIDLYPRWIGSQIALDGNSPYSLATRQKIWLAIYGSTETPNGNPFGFYYPPAVVTLLAPIILLGVSLSTAAMIWCALNWALYSTFLSVWIMPFSKLANARWIIPILLIGGWFFRPAFSNYILGQFALFSILMGIAAWFSFEQEKPGLAGILCALSLVKPSLTILPILLLLAMYRRNLVGVGSFLISSAVLYLPPTILLGWWVPDFLKDISAYALENEVAWSYMNITTWSGILWLILSLFLFGFGMQAKDHALSLASILAFNVIFMPHTADYDLVAFLPLLVYLSYHWLFLENQNRLLTLLFFVLLWFPWISLAYFLVAPSETDRVVESWYRFIWLTYPNLILISVLLTRFSAVKSWLGRFRIRAKPQSVTRSMFL